MKKCKYDCFGSAASLLLLLLWSPTAWGRIYPPCQNIFYNLDATNQIRYSIVDPVTGHNQEEIWNIGQGAERIIESVRADQGMLTWIARYRNLADSYYTFEVHFRIYDPGRGSWRVGFWGPFSGYETALDQHQVKDGVVAWKSRRRLGPNPTDMLEHQVVYTTYDPEFGGWQTSNSLWQVTDKTSPEVLRVKNGIVAWPMNNGGSGQASGEHDIRICATTYDHESRRWVGVGWSFMKLEIFCSVGFDWIEIYQDTAQVQVRMSCLAYTDNWFLTYDPYNHKWLMIADNSSPYRRAYFVTQPGSGIVPVWMWFWDCSTALEPPNIAYNWTVALGETRTNRSPGFRYTVGGSELVIQQIIYNSQSYSCNKWVLPKPPAPPPGEISINNGDAYTTSAFVLLGLKYGPSDFQMCFRQAPGFLWWSNWELVAPAKEWTLSTLHVAGESPDGPHTVYVKFRDSYGTESRESQATIILDITPPTGALTLNGGAARTSDPLVLASWSTSDAYGPLQMSYTAYNEEDAFYLWTFWENYQPTNLYFPFSGRAGKKTVIVRFKDAAGNVTQLQQSIQLDWRAFLPLLRR